MNEYTPEQKAALINKAVQRKMGELDHDEFYAKCEELWRADGCPLNGDMMLMMQEEYNNAAIEAFTDDFMMEAEDALDD